jgi:hypothetical protein
MVTASSPQHGPPQLARLTHASSGTAPCTEVYIVVRHLYATFSYSHIPFHFFSASTKPNSTREISPKFQIKSSDPSQENSAQQHGDPTRFGMERVFSVEEIPNPYRPHHTLNRRLPMMLLHQSLGGVGGGTRRTR